jgi:tripartite-type tricarboxylate transporter receptor subunit TctC
MPDPTSGLRRFGAAPALTALIALGISAWPTHVQAADFYQGRTVNMIIGFDVGGGYDLYARLVARHLGSYLGKNATVVPQNMPGAGGLNAMNYLYRSAAKDGSVLGTAHSNVALGQVLGGKNIEYDARRFNWVGRATSTVDVHYAWHTSPVRKFDDIRHRETFVAGTGPSSNSTIMPRVLNELTGTRFKLVTGFKGTNDANLAMERGEVEMVLKPWEGVKSGNADWLRDHKINLIVQYAINRHPDMAAVPTIVEVMQTPEQKQIMRLFVSTSEIGRSLMMPPGVPRERVEAMRRAFMAMTKDPAFRADAAKAKMELDPMSGADLQSLIADTFEMPPALVAKAKALYEKR